MVATVGGNLRSIRRDDITWLALRDDLRELECVIDAHAIDCVMPLTESLMTRLATHRLAFPKLTPHQQRLIANKHALLAELSRCGVAVPLQRPLDTAHELGFPLVLKGSTGAAGSRVKIVDDARALAMQCDRIRALDDEWQAQELLPSSTYLVGGVFHAGRPLRLYAAEKLEQFPARTGPAIRLRSDDTAALVDIGTRAVAAISLTGLASVDIMHRADGSYVVLEINPRPWSSICGAADAGVDLFTPLADLIADRIPIADLRFASKCESRVFPRYLLDDRYWNVSGVARAVRDLLSPRGRDWRDLGFALHSLARLYMTRAQWRDS